MLGGNMSDRLKKFLENLEQQEDQVLESVTDPATDILGKIKQRQIESQVRDFLEKQGLK